MREEAPLTLTLVEAVSQKRAGRAISFRKATTAEATLGAGDCLQVTVFFRPW